MVSPGLKNLPLVCLTFSFFRDIIEFLKNVADEYGDVAYSLFGGGVAIYYFTYCNYSFKIEIKKQD